MHERTQQKGYRDHSDRAVVQMLMNVFPARFAMYALNSFLSAVNGVVISRTQPLRALSAMALCAPVTYFRTVLQTTIATGMVILCGHKVGRGQKDGIGSAVATSLAMAVAVGAVAMAAVLGFRVPIARLLGANDELLPYTVEYLSGMAVGLLPEMLIPVFVNIIQMNGSQSDVIKTVIVRIALTLTAVWIVAFPLDGGLFQIAAAGAVVSAMLVIFLCFRFRDRTAHRVRLIKESGLSCAAEIVSLGFPAAAVSLMTGLRDVFLNNAIVSTGGAEAAAAMGVLSTVWFLIDAVVYGFGRAVGQLASISYGEQDADNLQSLFRAAVKYGLILTAAVGLLYGVLIRPVASLLTDDPIVIGYAVELVRIYAVGRLAVTALVIFINLYQSCKKTLAVYICNVCAFFAFPILETLWLKNSIGVTAVWLSYTLCPLAMLLLLPLMCALLKGGFPKSLSELFLLNDIRDGVRINRLISSREDAVGLSAELMSAFRQNGLSSRKSYLCALCIEETVINILDSALFCTADAQKQAVDVRVCIKDDTVAIRFRDNAPGFDPVAQAAVYNAAPDDTVKNIGYRIVSGLAREMSYSRIYDMNILRIEL